jgi:cytochrome P450
MSARTPQLEGYDPLSEAMLRDPLPAWDRARAEAPVFWAPAVDAWMVSRRADVLRVLADPVTFSSAGNLGQGHRWSVPSLANGDPPGHAPLRKVVNRAFTRRRVAELEPGVVATAERLVAAVAPRGHADVLADLARPLSLSTLARAAGFAPEDEPAIARWLDALDVTTGERSPADALAAAEAEHAAFAARCEALLDARGCGLAAVLAGEPRPRALSALLQVVMAGVATTAHLIAHTVALALAHGIPVAVAAGGDPSGGDAHAVVEEALRHASVIRAMPRTATRDVRLGGARVAAGDGLLVLFASANREAGDGFCPGRTAARDHLAFGRGAHFCPGAPLARVETVAALRALAALPGLRLAGPPEPWPMLTIHALRALPVAWDSTG